MKTIIQRALLGTLKSRRAIERFLSGDSTQANFLCRVIGDDAEPTGERLRPYEAANREWYCDELAEWVCGRKPTSENIDYLDAARKANGGRLTLRCWEGE